jgi:CspA family cold shock protein
MTPRMTDALNAERIGADAVVECGTVRSFDPERGFGFISPDEGDGDILVRATSIAEGGLEALTEGARVEFEIHEGGSGLEAFDVVSIDAPA